MDILNLNRTCSEVNLPLCKAINKANCKYTGRCGDISIIKIQSPMTTILLLIVLLSGARMMKNTKRHYAAVGRKEFVLFIYMYLSAILVELVLATESTLLAPYLPHLVTMQLTLSSTALFVLLLGGITPHVFITIGFFKSIVVLKILSLVYFIVHGSLVSFSISAGNDVMLFVVQFVGCLVMAVLFIATQLFILYTNDAEIWAYGTLTIAAVFFALSGVVLLWGGYYIAYVSERYMDSFFFFHLAVFSSALMVHKYWLSICDFEVETAALMFGDEK